MAIMTEVLNPLNNTDVIVGPRYVKTRLWANKQSNQDLYCLLTELLDKTKYIDGEQRPGQRPV